MLLDGREEGVGDGGDLESLRRWTLTSAQVARLCLATLVSASATAKYATASAHRLMREAGRASWMAVSAGLATPSPLNRLIGSQPDGRQ